MYTLIDSHSVYVNIIHCYDTARPSNISPHARARNPPGNNNNNRYYYYRQQSAFRIIIKRCWCPHGTDLGTCAAKNNRRRFPIRSTAHRI